MRFFFADFVGVVFFEMAVVFFKRVGDFLISIVRAGFALVVLFLTELIDFLMVLVGILDAAAFLFLLDFLPDDRRISARYPTRPIEANRIFEIHLRRVEFENVRRPVD